MSLGYDRDIALLTSPAYEPPEAGWPAARATAAAAVRATTGAAAVRLDRDRGLLTVPAGTALDLGATAKAQTAEWAAAELAARYGCSVLVELGGDLAVAGDKAGWQVVVAERAGEPGEQLTLHAGGLATSTITLRRWLADGQPAHHILDPATGRPATGPWRTVTVAADSALSANTCSTAAIVLGQAAEQWLTGQRVAARLVDRSGTISAVGGWPC